MRFNTMRVRLLLFGKFKDHGEPASLFELNEGASVGDLLATLEQQRLLPGDLLRSSAVAVNHEYAVPAAVLREGDEVAILPPVSGGGK